MTQFYLTVSKQKPLFVISSSYFIFLFKMT